MSGLSGCETSCSLCASKGSSCFSTMKEDHIDVLTSEKSSNFFKKGHSLFQEGGRPLGIYCVKKGKIKVYKRGFDGKEQIVQVAKEGDLLGYRALISEESYPVSAETLEETQVCFVTKHDFFELLKTSTELSNALLKQACHELGEFTEKLTNQAQMSVRERCAIILFYLYRVYGGDIKTGNPIVINLTRDDLANMVGTATETLIRLVHDFKDEGILESKGRKIMINEPLKLTKIGHIAV